VHNLLYLFKKRVYMMRKIFVSLVVSVAILALSGCAKDLSTDTYDDARVGQAQNVYIGTILDAQLVKVKGNNGVGGLAGAAAGGVGGSLIGGGWQSNVLGAIGGALIGGFAGDAADKKLSSQTGVRYLIQLDEPGVSKQNRQTVAIVQGLEANKQKLAVGTRVMILEGGAERARVVPYNNTPALEGKAAV
jgi:outer membrane lipoprotein SlyB